MRKNVMDLIVGLVFVIAMGALGTVTIFGSRRFGETKFYQVTFPRVYGLKQGNMVRCEGKEVGEVRALKLVDGKVLALLEVSAEVEIYKLNSRINVTPFSPLGGRVVEITRGSKGSGLKLTANITEGGLDESEPIHSGEAEGELLSALTSLINENSDNLTGIVDNIKDATDRLREQTNLAGKILTDETFAERVDGIVDHLNNASRSIETVTARLERGEGVIGELTVEGRPIQTDLRAATTNARDALAELRDAGRSVNQGEGLANVILNDAAFANDWQATSANISSITETLAEGRGLMRLVSEDEVYENVRDLSAEARDIGRKLNDQDSGPLGVLVSNPDAGRDTEDILSNLAETSKKLNDKDAGALGALIGDEELAATTRRVFDQAGQVIKELRDSVEDTREQAPVSAFIGTVFSAF